MPSTNFPKSIVGEDVPLFSQHYRQEMFKVVDRLLANIDDINKYLSSIVLPVTVLLPQIVPKCMHQATSRQVVCNISQWLERSRCMVGRHRNDGKWHWKELVVQRIYGMQKSVSSGSNVFTQALLKPISVDHSSIRRKQWTFLQQVKAGKELSEVDNERRSYWRLNDFIQCKRHFGLPWPGSNCRLVVHM